MPFGHRFAARAEDGWWYRASDDRRIEQIKAAIEIGLSQSETAQILGCSDAGSLSSFTKSRSIKWPRRASRATGAARLAFSRFKRPYDTEIDRYERLFGKRDEANPFDVFDEVAQ